MHAGPNSVRQPSIFSNFAHKHTRTHIHTHLTLGSLQHRVRSGTAAAKKRDDRPENYCRFHPVKFYLKSPQTDLLFLNILVLFGWRQDLILLLETHITIRPETPAIYRGQAGKHALDISSCGPNLLHLQSSSTTKIQ